MNRNLLIAIAGIMLIFMSACDNIHNPFLPAKETGGTKHINPPAVNAAAPKINGQPQGAVYNAGDAAQALTVFASVSDDGTLSYQWYSNTVNSHENGTEISGETRSDYTPSTTALGARYYYVVVTNTIADNGDGGKKTAQTASFPAMIQVNALVIVINITGDVDDDDEVTYSPKKGNVGDSITLECTVAHTERRSNLLNFIGAAIDPVGSAGSETRTYTINAADASNGVITITAVFIHTDFELDPIAFTETGHITKTYGDAAFTNAITTEHSGSGAITYSSGNTAVASVDGSGQVTIHKVGSAIITAEKAADTTYAEALTTYTLTVVPKPVTITGLSAANKQYDGTTTATVTGTAVISGLVGGDAVTVVTGIAAFDNAIAGNGKTVTFSGWSLTGADAGNYILSAQPASVTADIESVSMIEMVPIPAGTFTMGSPESEPGRQHEKEGPQHSVTLSGFYIGKYEVTQEQYQAVIGNNPSQYKSAVSGESGTPGKLPVEQVTWYDTVEFCNKLSVLEGLQEVYTISGRTPASGYPITSATVTADFTKNGYRLPTEAQWEYACRAGTTTAFNNGNNGYTNVTLVDAVAWYTYNSGRKTHQVGLKAANAWGLYDMHGNVDEWCWDRYNGTSSYSSSPANNPVGPETDIYRIMRGGNWNINAVYSRSAYRNYNSPGFWSSFIGFRLVRP